VPSVIFRPAYPTRVAFRPFDPWMAAHVALSKSPDHRHAEVVRRRAMSKPMVTKLFLGGVVAVLAGAVVMIAGGLAAVGGNLVVINGSEVTVNTPTALDWTGVMFATLGLLAMLGGMFAGFIAWIGALVNTAQLEDKLWFIVLLVTGLFSFGFIAMLVYVLAGPDSTVARTEVTSSPPPSVMP
jgi:hypothetical protein